MTSSVLLCNYSPNVIDQLNLSQSREAMTRWHNKTLLVIFLNFYSNYDQTSGIIWWKKKVHNTKYAVARGRVLSTHNIDRVCCVYRGKESSHIRKGGNLL